MRIKTKILIGFVLVLILIIISGYLSYQSAENTIRDNLARRDINNFIKGTIQLSSDYNQTEASESYYVLTNKDKYLNEIVTYNSKVREDLINLEKLKKPVVPEDMETVFDDIELNVNFAISDNEKNVDLFKKNNSKNVYKLELNEIFKTKIEKGIDTLVKRLEQIRYETNQRAVSEASFTRIAIPSGTILALLILLAAYLMMNYNITKKEKAENELKQLNENLEKTVQDRTKNLNYVNNELYTEIEKREEAEKKLHKLNKVYLVLSNINQAIVRISDKKKLLDEVCRILVTDGGMFGAFVGLLDEDCNNLNPVSFLGIKEEFIKKLIEPSQDYKFGEGPTGIAIKTGKYCINNDIKNSKIKDYLKEDIFKKGVKSVCAFPLKIKNKVIGNLSFSSLEKDFFDETEIKLLDELAADISFALESIEREENRKTAEQELRLSEERYRGLFENMVEGYALCRMHYENGQAVDWTYLTVNESFEKMTCLKNVVGKKVSQVIPNIRQADPKLFEIYSRVALTGKPEKFEMFVEALKMWFWISVYSPEKEYFVAVFDVITERKQNEIKIRNLNRVYSILSNINQAIVRIPDKKKLLDEVCRVIIEDGKAKLAWVGFVDESINKVIPYSKFGFDNGYLDNIEVSILETPNGNGPIGKCIREGKYVFVNDIKNDASMNPWKEKALERGFLSACAFPIIINSKVIGAFAVYASEIDFYTNDEIKLMEELAADISFALESIELEEKRKAAEKKLNESESRLRRFYESGMLGVIYWNMDGQIYDANDKFLEIVGYTRDELQKGIIKWTDLTPPEYAELDEITSNELRNTGINKKPFEKEYIKKDGTRVPIIIAGAMLDDKRLDGVAFVLDNTERKAAEKALRESEKNFITAFNNSPVSMTITSVSDKKYILVNETFLKESGYSRDEVIGKTSEEIGIFFDYNDREKIVTNALKHGHVHGMETKLVIKSGKVIDGLIYSSIINLSGRPYLISSIVDISQRKEDEEKLKLSEARLANAMNIAHLGHWEYDVLNDVFTFNDQFYNLFKTTAKKEGGYKMSSAQYAERFVYPEDRIMVGSEIEKTIKSSNTDYSRTLEHRIIYADGKIGYISVRFSAIKDSNGVTIKTVGANQDITEQKLAEEKLIKSEQLQRLHVENTPLGVIEWDLNFRVTNWNPSAEKIFGYTKEEAVGKHASFIVPESFRFEINKTWNELINNRGGFRSMNYNVNKSGEIINCSWYNTPLLDKDNKIHGVASLVDDVTQVVKQENELKQALTEKEILLKEIHHRVKNNLQIVTSLLNMQAEQVKDNLVNEHFKISADRVRAMALIHQQLYRSVNLSRINFEYYLKDLVFHLYKLYCTNPDKIKINMTAPGVTMDIDNAVPCGLMINEIITNSFKHAFPGDRKGNININMKMCDDEYTLSIKDDGVGLPEIDGAREKKGLGNDLIKMLSEQLDSTMEVKSENGTEYIFKFKTFLYKKRV